MAKLRYPEVINGAKNHYDPGVFRKVLALIDTRKASKQRFNALPADLLRINRGEFIPAREGQIVAVVLAHNDAATITSFLDHYRALGVDRFAIVDDQSTDGTREVLGSQTDVDVWVSDLRYKDARRGRAWREWLFSKYGKNRWYLNVDSDEFLLFANYVNTPLGDLCRSLTARGQKRLAAPMLDFYPIGPLNGEPLILPDGQRPWSVATHFDATGYDLRFKKRGLSVRGGPRTRLFGAEVEAMKYPLIFVDNSTNLANNIHQPAPFGRNFIPVQGVLLHFKIFADFREQTRKTASDGQHFNGSAEYKKIEKRLEENLQPLTFEAPISTKFENVEQLIALGFLRDWRD